jgi:hypothetical protein
MLAAPELWGCAHTILRQVLQGISVIVSVHDAYCRGSRVSIVTAEVESKTARGS